MRTMWTMSTIMHSALSTDIVHQVDRFMRRLHASVHSQSHEFDTEMAFRRSLTEILEEILSPLNQEEQRVFQCLLQKL